jgi:cobalt-precorrin 5A hydrolase
VDLGEGLMVAGIGCRAGVSVAQVEAAIDAAITQLCAREPVEATTADSSGERASAAAVTATASKLARAGVTAIATPVTKAKEPGIQAVAAAWDVPLLAISQEALEAADSATVTRSEHSMAAMNVRSVAEAAALAGAQALANVENRSNSAPDATAPATTATHRLLQPRIIVGPVTCALADTTTT